MAGLERAGLQERDAGRVGCADGRGGARGDEVQDRVEILLVEEQFRQLRERVGQLRGQAALSLAVARVHGASSA